MYSTRYIYQILIKLEFSRPVFEQYTNIKFHENPSCWSRIVPHGRTDMLKLTVSFCSLAKASKKHRFVDMVIRNAVHVKGQSVYNIVKLASIYGKNPIQHTCCNIRHEMYWNRWLQTFSFLKPLYLECGCGCPYRYDKKMSSKTNSAETIIRTKHVVIGLFKLDVRKH